jgi:hypothetical protein
VRTRASTAAAIAWSLALAMTGCKKDEPAAATADAKTADAKTDSKDGKTGTGTTATGTGTGTNPADSPLSPATQIQRGSVLGHFVVANGSTLISEVGTQLVPSSQAAMVNEQTLRSLAGAGLGDRGKLATNLDLSKPFGCAVIDTTVTMVPVACVVGYTGGAAALATDLGNEGKAPDGAGHVAKFTVDGQDVFIDDLGGNAVVSNHAELFEKAKGYLEANIVGRAGSLASDIEIVVFPGAAMTRYETALAPILEQLKKVQASAPMGDNAFAKAMAGYQAQQNDRLVKVFKEMDQFTMAFSLEPVGFVVRTATFPVPGSDLEKDTKLAAAGAFDSKMLDELPKSSFLVAGYAANLHKVTDSSMLKDMKSAMIAGYAEALGKDPAAVTAAIDAFIAENDAIYGNHAAFALVHEPGTVGGLVALSELEAGQSGRESWKTWSAAFTPEAVLGPEAAKKVTWSFQADAATIGGVAVDRWTIEPTAESAAQIRKEGGEELAKWEPRLGGLKLVINRIEADGKAAFIVSPAADDKAVQGVIDALNGTNGLAGDPGLTTIVTRNAGVSNMFALDVKRGASWIKELMPPDKAGQIPADLGNALDDVFMASSTSATGSSSSEIVISQRLIDQIRALAK